MKKLFKPFLVLALVLAIAFPSISSQVVAPARSTFAFVTGGTITAFIEDVVTGVKLRIATWGGVYTTDFLIEVAKGNVEGHSIITKFGENTDIDILTTPESIWDGGGLYTWLPDLGGEALEVISTSINDTGDVLSAGTATGGSLFTIEDTGASFVATDGVAVGDLVINESNDQFAIITAATDTLLTHAAMNNGSQENFQSTANALGDTYRIAHADGTGLGAGVIHGIDGTGVFASEIYVMDGTTAVPLKRNYMGTHRMAGIIGATTAGNLGIIKSQTVADSTLTAQMEIGSNKTLMAVFRTPANKVCYFLKGYVLVSKTGNPAQTNTARFTWRITPFGSVTSINGVTELISTGDSSWQYDYEAIPGIPPLTLIDIRVDDVSHDDTGATGGMGVLIVDIGA
jgi:hypothetical protein